MLRNHLNKLDIFESAADGDLDPLAVTPLHCRIEAHSKGTRAERENVVGSVKRRPQASRLGPWWICLLILFLPIAASAATISEEIAAVEKIRGLKFTAPVKTVEIDRSDLPSHLRTQFEKSLPYSTSDWGDILRALRLIAPDEKDEAMVSSLLDLYQQQVLAYYDPPSRTFYTVKQLPEA